MRSKKVVIIIIAVIVMVLGGVVAWLFASGRLVWVNPGAEQITLSKIVCGDDLVETYNEALVPLRRDGAEVSSIDTEALKKLQTEVRGRDGYAGDPTCQTMLFWISVNQEDYEAAVDANDALKRLYGNGIYANSDLRVQDRLGAHYRFINSIAPEEKRTVNGFGG
jgi:hypothetical protein